MQKNYKVTVDITVSKNVYVKAENEEQAKTIAKNLVADDPFYYAKTAESFLEAERLLEVYTTSHPYISNNLFISLFSRQL